MTRKKNEVYHSDCVHPRFPKYSNLMFWGAFTLEMRGSHHFYATETADEKKVAQKDLQNINVDWHVETQILEGAWNAENAKRFESKKLKRI